MTWTVRVVPDAEAEFEASARWYDERAGLRTELIEAIDEAVYAIAEGPSRYPSWRPESPYRRYAPDYVEIVAFAHVRRRPGYWKSRT